MASNAWWAYGSEFQVEDGTGYLKVAEVLDISGPNMAMDSIDVTSQDGSEGWKDYIAGWRDAGEVSISANWLPDDETQDDGTADADGILQSFTDSATHNFRIVTPDDGSSGTLTIGMTGIVTGFGLSLPLTEQAKLDFSIKLTGEVTFT
jgi:predicted secreted protein